MSEKALARTVKLKTADAVFAFISDFFEVDLNVSKWLGSDKLALRPRLARP